MKKKDMTVLISGLRKLSEDLADLVSGLEGAEAPSSKKDEPPQETASADAREEPTAKVCSLEDVRAVLAEKARNGYRAEIKALISAHGARQLSDITAPEELAALLAEAEVIGNG